MSHEHNSQEICGIQVCGICYEEELLNSKDKARPIPELELAYDKDKHIMRMKRKSGRGTSQRS